MLKGLKPKDAPYFVWDSDLQGFGVRVFPSGTIKYVVQRKLDGKTKRSTIGAHGPFTPEQARDRARDFLRVMETGQDPKELERQERGGITIAELCDDYLAAAEKGLIKGKGGRPKKPSTLETDRGRIERHIKPLLGKRRVKDLTTADVNQFIEDVTLGKTAYRGASGKKRGLIRVQGGAGTATRTAGLLGGILSRAVAKGHIPFNPAFGADKPSYQRKERRLSSEEYGRLGQALREAEAEGESWQVVKGVWLIMLSGFRLGELVNLKWSELDRNGSCVRFEDTKEGTSVRPLGRPFFDVLATVEPVEGCPYVIPSSAGDKPFAGMPTGWKRIAKRAGFEDVTLHTLRRSFASVAGDLGYADNTIASLLGHAKGTITSRYIVNLDSVLVAAANTVAEAVLRNSEHRQMNHTL